MFSHGKTQEKYDFKTYVKEFEAETGLKAKDHIQAYIEYSNLMVGISQRLAIQAKLDAILGDLDRLVSKSNLG